MTEKVLVTGAGGRVGRALLSVLAEEKRGLTRSELDIADAAAVARVFDSLKPTVVINAAAWTDVAGAETHRDAAYRANAEGVRVLAAEAARRGIALIHYSTDYVFSGEGDSPWTETDRPAPTGVYGASKLEGERQFFVSGVRGAVIRAGWLHSGERDFISAVLKRALSGGELTVVDNQVGTPTSTDALARWTAAALPGILASPTAVLHHYVESGPYVSRYDFAATVLTKAQALFAARGESEKAARIRYAKETMKRTSLAPGIRPLNCRLATEDKAHFPLTENWLKAVDKSVENVESLF